MRALQTLVIALTEPCDVPGLERDVRLRHNLRPPKLHNTKLPYRFLAPMQLSTGVKACL